MTVKELIEQLSNFPVDTRVVVQGYEDGFDEASALQSIMIQPNPVPKWYYGKFIRNSEDGEQAVLLFGRPRVDGGIFQNVG